MMMNLIKRLFRRLFRSMISPYVPTAITIIFAIVQGYLFPDSPVWPVGVFFIFVALIYARYVKW